MKNFYTFFKLVTIIIFISLGENVQSQPKIAYTSVVTGLSSPVDAVFAPGDGRMFIAQQNGLIRIRNGASFTNFANIGSVLITTGGEQGLLSLAFHPDYGTNRYFFVLYTAATTGAITVARYRRDAVNPNAIEPTGTVLLSIPKPTPLSSYSNHNGGKIIFGADGYLYISTGDGGSGGDPGNRGQSLNTLLGKMLRIDVNSFATSAPFYDIPPTNPWASGIGGLPEIFSYGLRNPWRWSFDSQNGDFWIADVGQGIWEEMNHASPARALGGNYGWRCYEGAHTYNTSVGCTGLDTISPVSEYGHNMTTGGFSITGGYVYRGTVFPTLQGYYMATDYISGHVWLVRHNGTSWQTFFQSTAQGGISSNVSGFAESPTGVLYAVNRGGGRIDSISVTSTVPVIIRSFTAVAKNGYNQLRWESSSEINTLRYNIEVSEDGVNYTRVGNVAAANTARSYDFNHTTSYNGYLYYRLAIDNTDGSLQYSNIVRVKSGDTRPVQIYPTLITKGNVINIELSEPAKELILINTNGQVILRKNLNGLLGNMRLTIPAATSAGLYLLRIVNNNKESFTEKIMVQ